MEATTNAKMKIFIFEKDMSNHRTDLFEELVNSFLEGKRLINVQILDDGHGIYKLIIFYKEI